MNKKEIDEMLCTLYDDDSIRELIKDWLEIRKLKRTPNTRRALEIAFKRLPKCAEESNLTIQEYLEEVILRGWIGFYPIKNYETYSKNY